MMTPASSSPPLFPSPVWVVAFSGHRRLSTPDAVTAAIGATLTRLMADAATHQGHIELLGSAASGADLHFHEAARTLNVPFHVVLPLPEEAFAHDFDEAHSFEQARASWRGATSVRVAASTGARPDCYVDVNLELLDSADLLVAIWDGEPARGRGGTGELVEMARAVGLPLVIIRPDGATIEERTSNWTDGAGVQTLRHLVGSSDAPREGSVAALQQHLDAVAVRDGSRFRNVSLRLIVVSSIATLLGGLATVIMTIRTLPVPESEIAFAVLMAGQAALIVGSLVSRRRLREDRVADGWVARRFASELLRGLVLASPFVDPLKPLVGRLMPEWRRFAVSAGLALVRERSGQVPWTALRDAYVAGRLTHPASGQIGYFHRCAEAAAPLAAKVRRATAVLSALSVGSAVTAIVFKLLVVLSHFLKLSSSWLEHWTPLLLVRVLPIIFPLAATTLLAISLLRDSLRRDERYTLIARQLEREAHLLSRLESPTAARAVIEKVESLLLNELLEWRFASRTGHEKK